MKTSSRITTAAALAVLTGSAFGMQPAKESGRERPARDRTVLRGPDDAGRPDRGDRPADRPGRNAEAARPAGEPGFQMIAMAIRGLQRSDDETLRLTEDQTAQIRAISVEYREATQKFMEENKDEIAKIRAVAGENRGERANDRPGVRPGDRPGQNKETADRPGARPTPGEGNTDRSRRPGSRTTTEMEVETDAAPSDGQQYTPEQRAEAREKLRAMMEAAPHEKQAKQKLMAVLTEPQQARVKEIIKAQAERVRERAQGDRPGIRPQRDARPTEVAPDAAPADRARPGDRPVRRQRPGADG
jgi:Spy/CpxP family protein refolding chaperone